MKAPPQGSNGIKYVWQGVLVGLLRTVGGVEIRDVGVVTPGGHELVCQLAKLGTPVLTAEFRAIHSIRNPTILVGADRRLLRRNPEALATAASVASA